MTLSQREHEIMTAAFGYAKHCGQWKQESGEVSRYDNHDLELAFANGANWADFHQWHDATEEKPVVGQEVVWHIRFRTPKGTWLNGYISDRYDGEYEPDGAEHWMYIPNPSRKGGTEQWPRKN